MDETPNLLSNIRFKETKKGYDPEQVDNFMLKLGEQVGELREMLRQAAQRAEVAEAKVNDAAKAKAAAEAEVAQAKADVAKAREEAAAAATAAAAQPANEIEAASGVLAMAQKTAEAAVEEAEAKAKDIVAEGRSRAAVMVIEAEQEIDRIKSRASQQIDKLAAERTAEVDAEVLRLKAERDQLKVDVDQLRSYVEEHRSKLRLGVEALERIINEQGALDMADAPDVSASEGLGARSGDSPAAPAPDAPPTDAAPSEAAPSDAAPSDAAPQDATPTDAAPADAGPEAATAAPVTVAPADAAPPADVVTTAAPDSVTPVVIPAPEQAPTPAPEPTSEPAPDTAEATPAGTPAGTPAEDDPKTAQVPIITLEDIEQGAEPEKQPAPDRARAEDPAAAVQVSSLLEAPAPQVTKATPVVIGADTTVDGAARASSITASAPAAETSARDSGSLFGDDPSDAGEPTQLFDVLGDEAPGGGAVLTRGDAPATTTAPTTAPTTTPLVNRELPLPTPGKNQADSSLGSPDAEADEAMRAFFEQDADASKEQKSGRFLRRK